MFHIVTTLGVMSSQMDTFSLDNTLAGRLAQAGITGVSLSLPDYVDSRIGRFLLNTLITVGGAGLVVYLNPQDENASNDPAVLVDRMRQEVGDIGKKAGPDSDTGVREEVSSPLKTWLVIIGALAAAVAITRLEAAGRRWLVRTLAKRGVKYPNTVIGGIGAALVFAFTEFMYRQQLAENKAARP